MHVRSLARVHVRRRYMVCVYRLLRQEDGDGGEVLFFPRFLEGRRGGPAASWTPRRRSPFDDERKKGGKARGPVELPIR